LAKLGTSTAELRAFLVTLVTQLFEAEAQAKTADKKEAQATAALLASVQAQREGDVLDASTKATIDRLVGEGFNAPLTLRDHVKRWADMIRAEYEADTLRQAQLAKALAEGLSATPDTRTEQQRPILNWARRSHLAICLVFYFFSGHLRPHCIGARLVTLFLWASLSSRAAADGAAAPFGRPLRRAPASLLVRGLPAVAATDTAHRAVDAAHASPSLALRRPTNVPLSHRARAHHAFAGIAVCMP
jgi:hypothetical protein